tara:strand:+ start:601 stop:2052 length:1452 start_codon:yes stop_codon:yes gene_type:complete
MIDCFNSNIIENKILIIGDIILDEYQIGEVNRVSPEAPVPIINIKKTYNSLGAAGNVLKNIISIGGDANLVTLIGHDEFAKEIDKLLSQISSNNIFFKLENYQTIKKTRIISSSQQILRIDYENNNFKNYLEKKINELINIIEINSPRFVILSDYNKGFFNKKILLNIIQKCNSINAKILIDPKNMKLNCYANCFLLKPNASEFKNLFGFDFYEMNNHANIFEILDKYSISNMLLTLGSDGMRLFTKDGKYLKFKSEAQEVFDVTGSGDTVIAILTACLAIGVDLKIAIKIAIKATALTIKKLGSASLTFNEFQKILIEMVPKDEKTFYLPKESSSIKDINLIKRESGKIVFTNGCFDILHLGHIDYLKKAKKLGNILVVGINTDESIKRIKGKLRPINSLDARLMILQSLNMVDYVIPFEEDNPLNLIKSLKPDVLVKGGDYSLEEIVGYDFVKSYGGEVKTIEFLKGFSTTKIIKKINNKI